jgi:hypothetical protein
MSHWAAEHIGRPWSPEYDCWAFVREVFHDQFGVDLPEHAAGVLILNGARNDTGLRPHDDDGGQEGDLVLMRTSSGKRHVGVMTFANGRLGVVHNDGHIVERFEDGVLVARYPVGCVGFTTLKELRETGCGVFQFWRKANLQ